MDLYGGIDIGPGHIEGFEPQLLVDGIGGVIRLRFVRFHGGFWGRGREIDLSPGFRGSRGLSHRFLRHRLVENEEWLQIEESLAKKREILGI